MNESGARETRDKTAKPALRSAECMSPAGTGVFARSRSAGSAQSFREPVIPDDETEDEGRDPEEQPGLGHRADSQSGSRAIPPELLAQLKKLIKDEGESRYLLVVDRTLKYGTVQQLLPTGDVVNDNESSSRHSRAIPLPSSTDSPSRCPVIAGESFAPVPPKGEATPNVPSSGSRSNTDSQTPGIQRRSTSPPRGPSKKHAGVRFSDPGPRLFRGLDIETVHDRSVANSHAELSTLDEEWGVLFDGEGHPTPRLEQVLRGFANCIVSLGAHALFLRPMSADSFSSD